MCVYVNHLSSPLQWLAGPCSTTEFPLERFCPGPAGEALRPFQRASQQRVVGFLHPGCPAGRAARARMLAVVRRLRPGCCASFGSKIRSYSCSSATGRSRQPCSIHRLLEGLSSQLGRTGRRALIEAADIFPALRAHGALRLVGDMEVDLAEDRFADLAFRRAASGSSDCPCSQPGGAISSRSHRVGNRSTWLTSASLTFPPLEPAWPAQDQHDPGAVVGQVAFHRREGQPVVGGADHQRVLRQPAFLQRCQHPRPFC